MAQVLITESKLNSLAQRIAAKSSAALPLTIDQMISSVNSINVSSGGSINLQEKTISPTTESQTVVADSVYDGLSSVIVNPIQTMTSSITNNGTYLPTAGKYFASVTVNVPQGTTINNLDREVTPTTSTQEITAPIGYTGLGTVTVNPIPSQYIIPTGSTAITANGSGINVSQYASVDVNVPTQTINNQAKSATPTESQQIIKFDSGYTGLSQVTIAAISSSYVGSNITSRTSTSVTVSGATVSVPVGYYSSAVSKSVADGSVSTPATIITANPSISVDANGKITATVNASKSVTPNLTTGYIDSATAGTVTASGSATQQLTIKAATTYTPGTSAQTIASGTYLTGTQTIVGDADLIAGNIKSGVTIFNVTGTYAGESVSFQNKTATPSETVTTVTPDNGYAGLSSVTIEAISSSYVGSNVNRRAASTITPTTTDQTIAADTYLTGVQTIKGSSNLIASNIKDGVTIFDVTGTFKYNSTAKTITPSESVQTATPGTGYDGLSSVTVAAIPNDYIGSSITSRNSLSVSGPTVTASAGYYASAVSTSVATMTPDVSSTSAGSLWNTINATPTMQYINLPVGYNSTARYARVFVSGGSVSTPATTITATPTISVSTAGVISVSVSSSKSVTPTLTTGYISTASAGTITVTGSSSSALSTLGATTYTPGTTNQTIASGIYLKGAQTISGDADLIASNIKSGVTIFNVTGTYGFTTTAKTITPSESVQTATPGTGYDGLSQVTVAAISSSYIGSNIPTRTSSNVTINGASVTVASGYYSTAITKSVTTATQATPSITVSTAGVITASATQTAGYVSGGTKSTSTTLSTAAGRTITPGTSATTAIAANTYALGAITVAGDANLIPANISADVSIFGVTGSLEFVTYYTGSTTPSSNLGSNGDIYLKTDS